MKYLLTTVAAALVATSASAGVDLGNGLSFGGEVVAERNVDQSDSTIVVTPELSYTRDLLEITLGTDLSVYDNEFVLDTTIKTKPTLDLGVTYDLREDLELYGNTSWDLEAETRGDLVIGAKFSF